MVIVLAHRVRSFLRPSFSFDTRWTSRQELQTIIQQRLHRWQLWMRLNNEIFMKLPKKIVNLPAKIPGCAKKLVGLSSLFIIRTPLSELVSVGLTGTWCVLSGSTPPRVGYSISFFFSSMPTVICVVVNNERNIFGRNREEKKEEIVRKIMKSSINYYTTKRLYRLGDTRYSFVLVEAFAKWIYDMQ